MNENNDLSHKIEDEWHGDAGKDTVTYRYIDLSASVLELAFEENENLFGIYEKWIDSQENVFEGNVISADIVTRSAILSDFSPEEDTKIIIFSLPRRDEFLTSFKTPAFGISVSFSYDFERMDIIAARVVSFKGDVAKAVGWAESINTRIDEAFAKLQK